MALRIMKTGFAVLLAVSFSACGGGGGGGGDSATNDSSGGSTTVSRTYQLELEEIELSRADSGEVLVVEDLPLSGTEVSVTE